MTAGVTKTANGRWKAITRTGGRDSRRVSRTFDRKADAEQWLREIRRRKQLGEALQPTAGVQRLDEFMETYWVLHAIPNLEASTRSMYRHVWEKHIRPALGSRQLLELTPKRLNRYRAELLARGVGEPTVRKVLTVLQSVLTLAVTEEELPQNPVARVRKPGLRPARQRVPVPVPVIERLRADLELRDRTLISVLAYAGLRPQEALALRREDLGRRTLHIGRKNVDGELLPYTKTRDSRTVRVLEPLMDDLAEWTSASAAEDLLFTRSDGRPWRETDYRNWRRRRFEPAARRAGLDDPRPYDLRATWVSLMIFEGHTVIEVARQAGHTPETALRHYARVFDDYDPAHRVGAAEQIYAARRAIAEERVNGVQPSLPGMDPQ